MDAAQESDKKGRFNIETLEAELKEWGFDLGTFKARAEKASAELKVEYEKQVTALRAKCADAKLKLEEWKKSGTSVTAEMEKGIEAAWADLKNAFGEARRLHKEQDKGQGKEQGEA